MLTLRRIDVIYALLRDCACYQAKSPRCSLTEQHRDGLPGCGNFGEDTHGWLAVMVLVRGNRVVRMTPRLSRTLALCPDCVTDLPSYYREGSSQCACPKARRNWLDRYSTESTPSGDKTSMNDDLFDETWRLTLIVTG